MRKFFISGMIGLIFVMSPLLATAGKWYQGGTLHRASVNEWNNASYSNKLATASDWASTRPTIKAKVRNSGDIDTLRPYATELVECIDNAAAGKGYSNMRVSELAASCMILMGW